MGIISSVSVSKMDEIKLNRNIQGLSMNSFTVTKSDYEEIDYDNLLDTVIPDYFDVKAKITIDGIKLFCEKDGKVIELDESYLDETIEYIGPILKEYYLLFDKIETYEAWLYESGSEDSTYHIVLYNGEEYDISKEQLKAELPELKEKLAAAKLEVKKITKYENYVKYFILQNVISSNLSGVDEVELKEYSNDIRKRLEENKILLKDNEAEILYIDGQIEYDKEFNDGKKYEELKQRQLELQTKNKALKDSVESLISIVEIMDYYDYVNIKNSAEFISYYNSFDYERTLEQFLNDYESYQADYFRYSGFDTYTIPFQNCDDLSRALFFYLVDTKGIEEGLKYLKIIRDRIEQTQAITEMIPVIMKMQLNEEGQINDSFANSLIALKEGFKDGLYDEFRGIGYYFEIMFEYDSGKTRSDYKKMFMNSFILEYEQISLGYKAGKKIGSNAISGFLKINEKIKIKEIEVYIKTLTNAVTTFKHISKIGKEEHKKVLEGYSFLAATCSVFLDDFIDSFKEKTLKYIKSLSAKTPCIPDNKKLIQLPPGIDTTTAGVYALPPGKDG